MTNLTPVLVSQPYIANRSSTAWAARNLDLQSYGEDEPQNMSRHEDKRNENSNGARSSGGKSEM